MTQATETQTTETQTEIIVANIDKQEPSILDASDCTEMFSDWGRLVLLNGSATGRALKYVKNKSRWSLASCDEVWTLRQWSEVIELRNENRC